MSAEVQEVRLYVTVGPDRAMLERMSLTEDSWNVNIPDTLLRTFTGTLRSDQILSAAPIYGKAAAVAWAEQVIGMLQAIRAAATPGVDVLVEFLNRTHQEQTDTFHAHLEARRKPTD